MMGQVYIGRQPIFDEEAQIAAYELLFRSSSQNSAPPIDGDQATSQIIIDTFLEVGLDKIVGRHRAFINLTRNFIVGDCPLPLSPEQVGLEILEDIAPDDRVVAALWDLARQGYLIALDDFEFRPELAPLLEFAHIVKLDVMGEDPDHLARRVEQLRPYNVKLLAEKVETYEEFEHCKALGFTYFQGYFLCKPHIVQGKRLPANRLVILRLLSKLQDPDAEIQQLEELIVQDVPLTYRLLRYINSACVSLRSTVDSIRGALMLIGTRTVRNWVSLILLTRISDKPQVLMLTALVRAKMCELLAQAMGREGGERYFTVGLFSVLDAMMDCPMGELLEAMPLTDEIKAAVLDHGGELGTILQQVVDYEQADWDRLEDGTMDADTLRNAYLEAIQWASESYQTILPTG